MAVAFSVICMADLGKRLITASPLQPFVWKRFIDNIFSFWNVPMEEVPFLSTSLTFSALRSNLFVKCHPNALFFSTQKYSEDLAFQLLKFSIDKPTSSLLKLFSIHTSHPPPFQYEKGFYQSREALRLLRTNSVKENFNK